MSAARGTRSSCAHAARSDDDCTRHLILTHLSSQHLACACMRHVHACMQQPAASVLHIFHIKAATRSSFSLLPNAAPSSLASTSRRPCLAPSPASHPNRKERQSVAGTVGGEIRREQVGQTRRPSTVLAQFNIPSVGTVQLKLTSKTGVRTAPHIMHLLATHCSFHAAIGGTAREVLLRWATATVA